LLRVGQPVDLCDMLASEVVEAVDFVQVLLVDDADVLSVRKDPLWVCHELFLNLENLRI
jgi:hypothetical protein